MSSGETGPSEKTATETLIETITAITTQPQFLELVQEIQESAPAERVPTAVRLATLDGLRSRGIPVEPRLRITTRYFEDPDAPLRGDIRTSVEEPDVSVAAASPVTICVSLGAVVCVSVGGPADGDPQLPPPATELEHPKHL